ncbi:MAG: hypothetical protein ACRCUS_05185, partial [Anaerovoracaceae bacterium]
YDKYGCTFGEVEISIVSLGDTGKLGSVKCDRVQYKVADGKSEFDGLAFNGEMNLARGVLPFIDTPGLKVNADVDTFEAGKYQFDGELNIVVLYGEGQFGLKNPKTSKSPVFDNAYLKIQGEPGIPIVPEVIHAVGGGGGVSGVADLYTGDYKILPPIKGKLTTVFKIIEVIFVNASINAGPTELTFEGNVAVGKGPFLIQPVKKVKGGYYGSDDYVKMRMETEACLVDGFEVYNAAGSLEGGYNWTNKKAIFEGKLRGQLQVPKFKIIWSYGPYTLLDIDGLVNTEKIEASTKILFVVKVGARFNWKNGEFKFLVGENGKLELQRNGLIEEFYAKAAENEKEGIIQNSINQEASNLLKDINSDESIISLMEVNTDALIAVEATREDLQVSYKNNEGKLVDYPLNYARTTADNKNNLHEIEELQRDGVNAFDMQAVGKTMLNFSIDSSLSNEWEIKSISGKKIEWGAILSQKSPEIMEVDNSDEGKISYTLDDLNDNKDYKLQMTASPTEKTAKNAGIENTDVVGALSLSDSKIVNPDDSIEFGEMKVNYKKTYKFNSSLPSGEYNTELGLTDKSGKKFYDSEETGDTIKYINPLEASEIRNLKVVDTGNETLKVSFVGSENNGESKKERRVNYEIKVYDEYGEPVYSQNTALANAGKHRKENYQTQFTYDIPWDSSENGVNYEAELGGLPADKRYIIEVTPYAEYEIETDKDNVQMPVKGKATLSAEPLDSEEDVATGKVGVELKKSKLPNITVNMTNCQVADDQVKGTEVTARGKYGLEIKTDTPCKIEVFGDKFDAEKNESVSKKIGDTMSFEKIHSIDISQSEDNPSRQITLIATSNTGAKNSIVYYDNMDKEKPVLYVATGLGETDAKGTVEIGSQGYFKVAGFTEAGASVKIYLGLDSMPIIIKADSDGHFSYNGNTNDTGKMKEVSVQVQDAVG